MRYTVSVYIIGENTMFYKIYEYLRKNGLKITFAESCTGGLLSKLITDIAGSSEVYDGGVVSYANDIKIRLLGVEESIIKNYGAVSAECAEAMANGVKALFNADIAVSVTGIAGPGGGSAEKPVGLVYVAIADKSGNEVYKLCEGDIGRQLVRQRVAERVAALLEARYNI